MRLGKHHVLVWWAPIYREADTDRGELVFVVEPPRFHFLQMQLSGLIRWTLRVGWLELRRAATDAEIAAMFPETPPSTAGDAMPPDGRSAAP